MSTVSSTPTKKWPKWKEFKELFLAGKAFFKNDGCSAVPDFNFRLCCMEHDYYYHTQEISRKEADKRLRECMAEHGWVFLPWLYWIGVRMFGGRPWHDRSEDLEVRITFTEAETDPT